MVIASVHVADLGWRDALATLRRAPTGIPGLRHADVGVAAPLGQSPPRPQPRRVGLVAFWDADADLDHFLDGHPLAAGWSARLEPLRAFGAWPGLPDTVPRSRTVDHDGPALVLTLGRLRLPQAVRFVRTSAKAERDAVARPGLMWATGLARPPFVCTVSLWRSSDDLAAYAYGDRDRPHPAAIAEDRRKAFHHRSAFVRFRPYRVEGSLGGRNALPEEALAAP